MRSCDSLSRKIEAHEPVRRRGVRCDEDEETNEQKAYGNGHKANGKGDGDKDQVIGLMKVVLMMRLILITLATAED